jgi:O-antigen/teichoic acid export membrane protein
LFRKLPSENVSSIATAVGYPLLATIQDDQKQMKNVFRKMLLSTFFVIVILMAGMAATANALVLSLVGEQWLPSVQLLQLLCIFGVMVPLNSMNVNILNVVGRSDLYLKLQLITQTLVIPNIFVGVFFGIKALIIGQIMIAFLGYVVYNHESNKILKYPLKEQIKDISPSIFLAAFMGVFVFLIGWLIRELNHFLVLFIQVGSGVLIVLVSGEVFKLKEYVFLKNTILEKVKLIGLFSKKD